MASRMDRYYLSSKDGKRTSRNSALYDEIYENRDYDELSRDVRDINVDTLSTSTSRQIDIEEVKALLEKRNIVQSNHQIHREIPIKYKEPVIEEDKNYDVKAILQKAKEEKKEEYRPRSLADTQVLTLQELITQKEYSNKVKLDEEDVKDLVDTICSSTLLQDINSQGLFDDLKSTGNTVVSKDIKDILRDKKQEIENTISDDTMDKSFLTSSLSFKQSDFEDGDQKDNKSSIFSKIITIFLIITCILFIILIIYIILQYAF